MRLFLVLLLFILLGLVTDRSRTTAEELKSLAAKRNGHREHPSSVENSKRFTEGVLPQKTEIRTSSARLFQTVGNLLTEMEKEIEEAGNLPDLVERLGIASAMENFAEIVHLRMILALKDDHDLLEQMEKLIQEGEFEDNTSIADIMIFSSINSEELIEKKLDLSIQASKFGSMQEESFGAWLKTDPDAALEWFERSMKDGALSENESIQDDYYRTYAAHLAKEDPGSFLELFEGLSEKEKAGMSYKPMQSLFANHPEVAAELLRGIDNERLRERLLAEVSWAQSYDKGDGLVSVIKEFSSTPEDAESAIREMAFRGGTPTDLAERVDWLQKHLPEATIPEMAQAAGRRLRFRNLDTQALMEAVEPNLADAIALEIVRNNASDRRLRSLAVNLISQISDPELQRQAVNDLRRRVVHFQDQQVDLDRMLGEYGLLNQPGDGE